MTAPRRRPTRLARRYHRPHPRIQDHKGRRSAALAMERVAVRPDGYFESVWQHPQLAPDRSGSIMAIKLRGVSFGRRSPYNRVSFPRRFTLRPTVTLVEVIQ